jgi:ABC-type uncharacterized transport system substrate-binding protein
VAKVLSVCCKQVKVIDVASGPVETQLNGTLDLLFGWYYLNGNFLGVKSKVAVAIVAGNERDMTRGAIAMLANNDAEAGTLAAKQILLPNLLKGISLSDTAIVRVSTRRFAINRTAARRHGITVALTLPRETVEFQ